MPTIYRFAKRCLQHNKVEPREIEIWLKHCESKGIEAAETPPVKKHPRRKKSK